MAKPGLGIPSWTMEGRVSSTDGTEAAGWAWSALLWIERDKARLGEPEAGPAAAALPVVPSVPHIRKKEHGARDM